MFSVFYESRVHHRELCYLSLMRNLEDRRYTLSKKSSPVYKFSATVECRTRKQFWHLNWQKGPNCRSCYFFSTRTEKPTIHTYTVNQCWGHGWNTGDETITRSHFFKSNRQTEEKHQGPAGLIILMTSWTSQTSPWSFYLVCLVVAIVMVWTEIKLPFNPPPLHMTSLWCASYRELWLVHICSPLWPAANQNSSAQHPPPQGTQWWNKGESEREENVSMNGNMEERAQTQKLTVRPSSSNISSKTLAFCTDTERAAMIRRSVN